MQNKYNNTFTMINLLLGAGPLILPYAFFKAGILLSSIWMIIISFISYLTAMYIS
jgi:amino acid permease